MSATTLTNFLQVHHRKHPFWMYNHTVAQWLALLPHSARDPGSIPGLGSLSVWSLHILPVSAWVSSGCSGFLPQSKRRAG